MKIKKLIVFTLGTACSLTLLSGCMAGMFEKEITVDFVNEGEVVDSGTVTQFKNIKSPVLDEAYIPTNYRFLGWTYYQESELDLKSATNFKTQYIGGGRMVHYMDVRDAAKDQKITLQALIMHKDDIPKDYHYAVVAWYDKAGTSGLNQDRINTFEGNLKAYLASSGVTQEDINTVVLRGYSGNVGPTTGQILYDDDVDIMFGWGSASNITTTGSIPESMIKQSEAYTITYNGEAKNRHVHRLSDNPGSLKVMEYIMSDACKAFFAA